MKACGIIAEYNPFHLGHRYQLAEAQALSGADVMVVAMSGNFVQRGEPAIEHKWARAEQALLHGADLVLEIPTIGACQASDFFARAGVGILLASGCQGLSFGVEQATEDCFWQALEQWRQLEEQPFVVEKGQSYAHQLAFRSQQYFGVESPLAQILQQPNQQLAFSYVKALTESGQEMSLYPVRRKGRGHLETTVEGRQYASGTALRQQLLKNGDRVSLLGQLPYLAESEAHYSNHWERYWDLLRYQIERSSVEELRDIYQVEEGIEYRLKRIVTKATSFKSFVEQMKNKRWTWTRLQRLCVYLLLGIQKEEMASTDFLQPSVVTVLGFNAVGQSYLKQLRKTGITFTTNYAIEALKRQQTFDRLYDMMNPTITPSAKRFSPIRVN